MRKQCVPGSLSPPPREPGHEARASGNYSSAAIAFWTGPAQHESDSTIKGGWLAMAE